MPSVNQSRGGADPNVRTLDYDCNGTPDLLMVDNEGGRTMARVLRFHRDGTADGVTTNIPIGVSGGVPSSIGTKSFQLTQTLDANGDGLTDVIQYETAVQGFVLYLAAVIAVYLADDGQQASG